jgi:membrane-bound lytic murein transglycosylase B
LALVPISWANTPPASKTSPSKAIGHPKASSQASAGSPARAANSTPKKVKKKTAAHAPKHSGPLYSESDDAMALSDDIASRRQLNPAWVRKMVGQSQYLAVVSKLMQPAPTSTPKNWRVYRSRFIDPIRIQAGTRFWNTYRDALQRAETNYGVPPEIIVGIIGVETIYGQQVGTFRVMDALSTLALDFPASHPRASERTAFFKAELEQLLSLAHRNGIDPMALRGSYAGAMGWPQFMPSSWARFAVDFDGDGKVDLFNNPVDVIGSVANYFKAFNWQKGMPTHFAVGFDEARLDKDALLAPDILPTFSPTSFSAKGAILDAQAMAHPGPLALVELQNGDEPPSYVAGTDNFYAITRYNWSSYYAMAVIELGQEVAREIQNRP